MREPALALGLGASLAFHAFLLSLSLSKPVTDAPMAPAVLVRLLEQPPDSVPIPEARKVVRRSHPVTQPAPQQPEATTIGQYRYLLAAIAARYKAYPPEALANGWEGDVTVRVAVEASGSVGGVRVARGSGHAALDDQAVEVFSRAAREVPVPQALWGREFAVELSAVYRAADTVR